jgi:aquaporin Z
VVLQSANRPGLSRITWLLVGLLVATYVIAFSPVSGFSLNPARTISSALFAGVWTVMWLYLTAPLLGMLVAATLYVLSSGSEAVLCAKIYHDLYSPCPFRCHFRRLAQPESSASRF